MRPDADGWLRLALWGAWALLLWFLWRLLVYAGAVPRWP